MQSVVIVGGGTAGWLTAGVIAARHQARIQAGLFSVTLVESPNVPIIGVGEGTWPTMRATLEKMGVTETEFFRHCDAAFKQGARFAKWTHDSPEDGYYHPLMLPQGFTQINLAPHWLGTRSDRSFSDYVCPQGPLCDQGLAPKMITTPEYQAVANYAYHLDAGKFGTFLRDLAQAEDAGAIEAMVSKDFGGAALSSATLDAATLEGRFVRWLAK